MASELVWLYVLNYNNPISNRYLEWAKNQIDETYKLKFEQIFTYLQVIIDFRTRVRNNQPLLLVSHSGLQNQHQELDAIVEEINKALKSLIPPVLSQRHWEIATKNYTNFMKVIQ
ncbi:hypothetical protein F8M41_020112 [Gigaspora margarita]|uniref:Uncharacterized protein n=1 Tax=Gigaspora margarita TaxID=4874 RepID=A0A8H4EK05_GIGMA|nr:hypothetical protein F8M41_020112 [Gigaspora margarita]